MLTSSIPLSNRCVLHSPYATLEFSTTHGKFLNSQFFSEVLIDIICLKMCNISSVQITLNIFCAELNICFHNFGVERSS